MPKGCCLEIMIPGEKGKHEYQMNIEILRNLGCTSNLVKREGNFLLSGHGGNEHCVLVYHFSAHAVRNCQLTGASSQVHERS
jgi:hypothetical protein